MDTRIPMMGQRPQINTPADLLSLKQLSLQVQGAERAVQSQQQMAEAMKQPGMFDEDGAPSEQAVQRAMQLDTKLGEQFLSARSKAMQQRAMTSRAQMLADARKAAQENHAAQAEKNLSEAAKKRHDLFKTLTTEIDQAGLDWLDANQGKMSDEDLLRGWRKARSDALEERENSGLLRSAGFDEKSIEMAKQKIAQDANPEESRNRIKSTKQREQEAKDKAKAPYEERKLGQGDRKLSLQEIGLGIKRDQGDRALDIRQQQADTGTQAAIDRADAAERKAGISEEQIKERREYGQAVIEIRRLESERKSRWNEMTSEERERHNKAMEEAKAKIGIWGGQKITKEQLDKGLVGGQKLDKETLLKRSQTEIAKLNGELERGEITQEQHDARIAKLTAQGKQKETKDGELVEITSAMRDKEAAKHGYMPDPAGGGGYVPIPGGWADPKTIEAIEKAKASARGKGGGVATGSQNLQGEELAGDMVGERFLAKVAEQNPTYAAKIKGIAEGRIALKDVGSTKERTQLINDVLRYKADYDEGAYSRKSGRKGEGNLLSEDALRLAAEQYISGDRSVVVGYGRNPATLAALKNTVAKIAKERGISGSRLASLTAEFEGIKAGQRALGTRTANLDVAARELDNFAGQALAASDKVPRVGFKPINELMRLGRNQWSAEQAAFEAYNRSVITAFAQVSARTGSATVHNTEEAEHMLNTAQTPEQYKAVIKALQNDARQAIKAAKDTKSSMSDEFVESSGGATRPKGATSPSQGAAPGGSPGPKKERPITATGPDGKKLMLKDGKWVPMQ